MADEKSKGSPRQDPSLTPAHQQQQRPNHPAPAPFRAQFFHDVAIYLRLSYHFWRGFHFMRGTRRAITVFGSARLKADHPFCLHATQVAAYYAKKGFTILTGGGPSIMQAANRGAFEAGGASLGVNIEIPREQHINPYVTRGIQSRYFFVRKVLLARYSEAFVVYPGGFGTLDEAFEIITLMQTGKMIDRPVVFVGREFWSGLIQWLSQTLIPLGMINANELERIHVVDTIQEVTEYLDDKLDYTTRL